jgi:hypothetical protein
MWFGFEIGLEHASTTPTITPSAVTSNAQVNRFAHMTEIPEHTSVKIKVFSFLDKLSTRLVFLARCLINLTDVKKI